VDRARILAATLTPPPARLGITHWSSRLLADHLSVDASTVLRTWRHHRVQPWRAETFKFSTDPELVAKVSDVVGLYLNPPENAIVLSIDEKSQIQALDRTQKTLPIQPGQAEQRTHDWRASQIPDMGPNRVPFRKWRNYMSERRKSFSSEFKDEAVKTVIEGSRAVADVARELGIGAETLRTWVNRYRVEHADEEPPLPISERARLRELEKENRELKMKAEFLGKAAAFFAQEYR
jgi:transposase-like protein